MESRIRKKIEDNLSIDKETYEIWSNIISKDKIILCGKKHHHHLLIIKVQKKTKKALNINSTRLRCVHKK